MEIDLSPIKTATQEARKVLQRDIEAQLEADFDILEDGSIGKSPAPHLKDNPERLRLRRRVIAAIEHEQARGKTPAQAVAAFTREAAFTLLNRFVALKMLEARELVRECISKGEESQGFRDSRLLASTFLNQLPDRGYRLYLESLFDELGREVGVLFDRRHVPGQVWPTRTALNELLDILNDPKLANAWDDEETIGWVYQFFNSDAENKAAKYDEDDNPKAPQNSQELAVRNQFFTPDYVVRFLVDNTLGRLWWEMRGGKTHLATRCEHLIHRPTEMVLAEGEEAPHPGGDGADVVAVPFRAKKDPRDIRILDPACGSGHFLLYAYDLFETIYEEAWRDPDSPPWEEDGTTLRDTYPDLDALRREIPQLILAHNLYGVDIDGRTAQIAGLALWMRAQSAWRDQNVRPADRPTVRKTNIVTAEPMPGEPALRREFLDSLRPQPLRGIVEAVFERLALADEAGLLLTVEQDVVAAVREAQERWETQDRQLQLVPGAGVQNGLEDPSNLPERDFWDHAEDLIYQSLREYAERGEAGLTRRLFADDATAGFAFVDLCRLRYDVAVMNPPFGTATPALDDLIEEQYPSSKMDLFAPFVERAIRSLVPNGFVGVLSTEAGFFRRTAENWRKNVVLGQSTLSAVAHLGGHVLKGATVRTAAYTMRTGEKGGLPLFLRLFGEPDRPGALLEEVDLARKGAVSSRRFEVPQEEFQKLPYAAFGYWCSPELRNAFVQLPQLGENLATVAVGLQTSKDPRFLRLRWELPVDELRSERWPPLAKGGDYSPFHDDVHLHLNWGGEGTEVASYPGSVIRNPQHYGKAGLTYPRRTNKPFGPRTLPAGCTFGDKGPSISEIRGDRFALLSLLCSRPLRYLMSLAIGAAEAEGGAGANSYEVNLVKQQPIPDDALTDARLAEEGRAAWETRAEADLRDETTALFVAPAAPLALGALPETHRQLLQHRRDLTKAYVEHQHAIDARVRDHYALSDSDWQAITEEIPTVHVPSVPSDKAKKARQQFGFEILQYLVGVAFGRWDIRYATGERDQPGLPDPFAPLPACPPGMLQDANGHLLTAPPDDYPVPFPPDGVLVDDLGHERDLVGRIKHILGILYPEDPAAAEADLLDLLGEKDLRYYFQKSTGFFSDHRKAYSKSNRKAPIYWPLSTGSKEYTVWLYYPRLTRNTLFDVRNVVTEKVSHAESQLRQLQNDAGAEPSADDRDAIEAQRASVTELRLFRTELEATLDLWRPDLTDGVLVNFAPLHRLAPLWRDWQKDLEKMWAELADGQHDWFHLAMHLWPERVVPKCAKHRHFAIAHGLEGVFFEEKKDGKWVRREEPLQTVENLIKERQSPAVKAARDRLINAK